MAQHQGHDAADNRRGHRRSAHAEVVAIDDAIWVLLSQDAGRVVSRDDAPPWRHDIRLREPVLRDAAAGKRRERVVGDVARAGVVRGADDDDEGVVGRRVKDRVRGQAHVAGGCDHDDPLEPGSLHCRVQRVGAVALRNR